MAITGMKTGLIEAASARGVPNTYLRWTVLTGAGIKESSDQVLVADLSTQKLGDAKALGAAAATNVHVLLKANNLLEDNTGV